MRFPRRRCSHRDVSVHYNLPDGQKIHIKSESVPELYRAGEILFEPDLQGLRTEGLSDMLLASVANAPSSLRQSLTQNVRCLTLSGRDRASGIGGAVWRLFTP